MTKIYTTTDSIVGYLFEKLRKSKKISQLTISKSLNITQSGYSRLENGQAIVKTKHILGVCRACGVKFEDFFKTIQETDAFFIEKGIEIDGCEGEYFQAKLIVDLDNSGILSLLQK